ncbi:MAG: hypothetical protein FWE92_00190 [Defluviitaleaceae bacterium]|nr:hypothetical protein [Defluviitaleaceae bacterium]
MSKSRTIIRLLSVFVIVSSLFVASAVLAAKPMNDVHHLSQVSNSCSCSCFWAVVSNSVVNLLQASSSNFCTLVAGTHFDYYITIVCFSVTSSGQPDIEDMRYGIFKPPKM